MYRKELDANVDLSETMHQQAAVRLLEAFQHDVDMAAEAEDDHVRSELIKMLRMSERTYVTPIRFHLQQVDSERKQDEVEEIWAETVETAEKLAQLDEDDD